MVVFFYLLYDFYFFILALIFSLCASSLVIFYFKNQFFFLFCLPYFLATDTTTFLFTSIQATFSSYFLLVYIACFLVYPVAVVVSSLLVYAPILSSMLHFRIFRGLSFCFFLFFFILNWLLDAVPVLVVWLTSVLQSGSYRVMRFTFDFSVDSWLVIFLLLLCLLLLFSVFLFSFISFLLLGVFRKYVFWFRFVFFLLLFAFLMFFVPYDFFLHVSLFSVCSLIFELMLLIRFFQISYLGRVA